MEFGNEQSGKFMQRFTDVKAEHGQMLPPIIGFEKMPLVTLEQAVDPLVAEIPEVYQMLQRIAKARRTPSGGLSIDEAGAIMLYSLEWKPREQSFYYIFNATLRAMDRNKLKPWFLYLRLLIHALSKLPVVQQTVYRGVKADLHELYPQNSTCVWWGFSSCTSSMKVLQVDAFLGQRGTRTMFHIDSLSAKSISPHSLYPEEEEVLLPAARLFQVVSSLDAGDGLHMIHLKEIQPEHPLIEDPVSDAAVRTDRHDRPIARSLRTPPVPRPLPRTGKSFVASKSTRSFVLVRVSRVFDRNRSVHFRENRRSSNRCACEMESESGDRRGGKRTGNGSDATESSVRFVR